VATIRWVNWVWTRWVADPQSGRVLECGHGTGLQFIQRNFLDDTIRARRAGLSHRAPSHGTAALSGFTEPSGTFRRGAQPGEVYHNTILYKFLTE